MKSRSRGTAVTALVAAAVFLPATMAAAHPGLRPNEVRPGETVAAELVIPHGCGTEGGAPEDGEEVSATTEVAIQWPEGVEFLPREVDGWSAAVIEDADGSVVAWDDDGGATTDVITLPLTIVASREAAGDIPVPVFQGCANGDSFRWAAGPDEEGDPAVRLTVSGDPVPTPTATATPTPVPTATEPTPAPTATAASSPTESPAVVSPSDAPTTSATPSPSPSAGTTPVAAAAAGDEDEDEGSVFSAWVVGGLLLGAAIASVVIWRRQAGQVGS